MSGRITIFVCLFIVGACKKEHAPTPQPAAAAPDAPAEGMQRAERRSAESAAAADVVRQYYAAIQARDFSAAYALWSGRGQASRQSFEAFQAGFVETRTTSVDIEPPGEVEGAAGSLYINIPVTVHAELNDGTSQQFTGSYTLRRVNDVEGATPEQRSWHLHSATLHPAK